jgi:hypothetical protein
MAHDTCARGPFSYGGDCTGHRALGFHFGERRSRAGEREGEQVVIFNRPLQMKSTGVVDQLFQFGTERIVRTHNTALACFRPHAQLVDKFVLRMPIL